MVEYQNERMKVSGYSQYRWDVRNHPAKACQKRGSCEFKGQNSIAIPLHSLPKQQEQRSRQQSAPVHAQTGQRHSGAGEKQRYQQGRTNRGHGLPFRLGLFSHMQVHRVINFQRISRLLYGGLDGAVELRSGVQRQCPVVGIGIEQLDVFLAVKHSRVVV
jgi:hypothetical protein